MCPTALGRKEKKLYNVHIVHWYSIDLIICTNNAFLAVLGQSRPKLTRSWRRTSRRKPIITTMRLSRCRELTKQCIAILDASLRWPSTACPPSYQQTSNPARLRLILPKFLVTRISSCGCFRWLSCPRTTPSSKP